MGLGGEIMTQKQGMLSKDKESLKNGFYATDSLSPRHCSTSSLDTSLPQNDLIHS
jgi:hypothetical protein